jgi:outer membrane protein insertion porin family
LLLESIEFIPGAFTSTEINDFLATEGDQFLDLKASMGWSHDSRNSALFPLRGTLQRLNGEVTLPGSDLEYYKASYSYRQYVPITRSIAFSAKTELGWGDAYGDTMNLPFFENFFAGGERSVRGYDSNSLGPLDSLGDQLGARIKWTGGLELIGPPPVDNLKESLRLSAFFDFGNVFSDRIETDEIRYSVGLGISWLSPVGLMNLSYGVPLNDKEGDEIENFQFNIGRPF